ncbi:unnamed protein product [Periconia digitata]|uniref:Uncharacterized protein n=1 Tax=Periconia digitata TaxID=1303443 RepID=A0A9W4U1Q6_9PLEO|nr:unnamed protein product [Periconia digitata]
MTVLLSDIWYLSGRCLWRSWPCCEVLHVVWIDGSSHEGWRSSEAVGDKNSMFSMLSRYRTDRRENLRITTPSCKTPSSYLLDINDFQSYETRYRRRGCQAYEDTFVTLVFVC